jgi:hypothetical protein
MVVRWEVFSPFEQILRLENFEIGISLQSLQWITGATRSSPLSPDIPHGRADWVQESLCFMKDEIETKYLSYLLMIKEDSNDSFGDKASQICSQKILTLLQMIQPLVKFQLKCHRLKFQPRFILFEEVLEDISLIHRNLISSPLDTIWDSPVGQFYIPKNSIFLLDDIRRGMKTCSQMSSLHGRYRTIVLDPPWSNKSARRGKVYQTSFENEDLIRLGSPLESLYHPGGCLVAIWVTNNKKIIDFVLNRLLKEWGLSYVDTWWWIKLGILRQNSSQYQPIFPLHSTHRKPYERVIIASKHLHIPHKSLHFNISKTRHFHNGPHVDDAQGDTHTVGSDPRAHEPPSDIETDSGKKRKFCETEDLSALQDLDSDRAPLVTVPVVDDIPQTALLRDALLSDSVSPHNQPVVFPQIPTEVIVSFPIRHSWKPPLQKLLHQSLSILLALAAGPTHEGSAEIASWNEPADHCDLELFARELRSGCTSLGNEVLFHQTVRIH